MAVDVSEIEWMRYMVIYGGNTSEAFAHRLDDEKWTIPHCLTACEIAFAECPTARYRLDSGALSEMTFIYVICSMVLRVARWSMRKSESNGAYTRTDQVMDMSQPGWEVSPDLHVTKKERALLTGMSEDSAPFGTAMLGLDRAYGR